MLITRGEKKRPRLLCLKCVDEFSASIGAELGEHQQRLQEPDASCLLRAGGRCCPSLAVRSRRACAGVGREGINSPSVVTRSGYSL